MHQQLYWQCGARVGLTGIFLDVAKGIVAVLAGRALQVDTAALAAGAVAVVAGQMWPVFSRFQGEKGNSTALGVAVTLTPLPFLVAAIPMLTGALLRTIPHLRQKKAMEEKLRFKGPPSLSLPLGMAVGFGVLPIAAWWLGEPRAVVLGYAALFFLIMLRRATADAAAPLVRTTPVKGLVNRLLYDRSEI
jgi:glycerol-3-phosphate acyltransferase PlsY